ncbi:hypothetical protein VTK73DRAFT_1762 [Phialemonium thermophilum]|uniref:Uncharacterized protein n=1 Tax=Phialemonium thermophilum TaxID=223376 RepID=A0ABR3VT73_9PEZI
MVHAVRFRSCQHEGRHQPTPQLVRVHPQSGSLRVPYRLSGAWPRRLLVPSCQEILHLCAFHRSQLARVQLSGQEGVGRLRMTCYLQHVIPPVESLQALRRSVYSDQRLLDLAGDPAGVYQRGTQTALPDQLYVSPMQHIHKGGFLGVQTGRTSAA